MSYISKLSTKGKQLVLKYQHELKIKVNASKQWVYFGLKNSIFQSKTEKEDNNNNNASNTNKCYTKTQD